MPFVFFHVEYCDMHFVFGVCDGNAHAAVEEYQRHFPDRRIPSRSVFSRIHQTMLETACLPSVAVQSEREVVRTIILIYPYHDQRVQHLEPGDQATGGGHFEKLL